MRFLRVLRFRCVLARRTRYIVVAVVLADHLADGRDRLRRDRNAVGTHIGDEAGGLAADVDAFIKTLRDPHGVRGCEAELAAGFLLQRRGGEGRLRIAARGLRLHQRDSVGAVFQRLLEILGFRTAADVEPLDLLAVGADEPRLEGFVARGRERRDQRPVLARHEFLDLKLAVANKAQRDGLHSAGRARARQFTPQHRGEREADQIIQRAARHVGVHQRAVDLAGVLHCLGDGLLGDGIEDDALDLLVLQRALLLHDLQDVPGDRLALPIRVGCEDQLVSALERLGDVVEPARSLGVGLPDHLKICLRIDRAIFGGEVSNMAVGGQNLVGGA